MNDTIDIIDGIPHVKSPMTEYNEPIMVTRWWPLPTASARVEQGGKCFYRGDGYYLVHTTRNGGMNFRLPAGGSTEATKITREPIPPPKTRLEVRWKDGHWEKLSKRDGWIDS